MLDVMRRGARTWVAKALMALLVVSFGIWGVAGAFTGLSSTTIATVGGKKIPVEQFQRKLQIAIQELSQQFGQPVTIADARKYGIDQQVLSNLIGIAALDQEASRLGLAAGDDAVARDITRDPTFRGANGAFDRAGYEMLLQRNGLRERDFVEDRRSFLMRKQLLDAASAGIEAPGLMVDTIYQYQNQQRVASYFIVPLDSVKMPAAPDDKTVEAYYKQAAIRFTKPETRDFTIMVLDPAAMAAATAIPDDELRQNYEARRAEFDVPEMRTVEQIAFPDIKEASAAADRIAKGESFEKEAESRGLKPADYVLGTLSHDQMQSQKVADATFALGKGAISAPIEGPLGPVIVRVTDITPGKTSTFDEVRDKLRQQLASQRVSNAIYDQENAIEDARAGGSSLEDIAKKNGLKLVRFTSINSDGTGADGKRPDALPKYPSLLDKVFRSEAGQDIDPSDTGAGGYYWLRVDAVNPAQQRPLNEVRADVIKLWQTQKQQADALALAQSLVEKGDKGASIQDLAKSVGRQVIISAPLGRQSSDDTFSRMSVANLFGVAPGKYSYGAAGYGQSLVIMHVDKIINPDPVEANVAQLKNSLNEGVQNDFVATLVNGLEKIQGVELNTRLLQQTLASGEPQN
ncbi:MAG: SurA N-terminal domain-containing protein [Parvibaculaceae bacterium]|nr:SurA N-terminal domain-containing protein [Parvibaculaceae bacterium]